MNSRHGIAAAIAASDWDAFSALFERTPEPMLLADNDRYYVDANPIACAFFGLEHRDIVGRRIDEFLPAADRAQITEVWTSFIEANEASGKYVLATQDGPRYVEFQAVANVLPGLHLSILRDCTERHHVDEERQLFTDIVSAVQVGLHVWELEDPDDPAGMRLVHANPATIFAIGIPPEAIVGLTLREVFPGLVETELPAIYAEVALGGAPPEVGDVVYGDDRIGDRVFSVRVFPLPKRRVGIAFNDVTTERRAAARALATLESMSDAFYTLDRDWRFTYLNPQSELLLQRKREELLGLTIWETFPDAVGSKAFDELQRAARERVTVDRGALRAF